MYCMLCLYRAIPFSLDRSSNVSLTRQVEVAEKVGLVIAAMLKNVV